jgi:transcriptional regulator with XRE-family HTH domain
MSQVQLAMACGVTKSTVWRWVHGKSPIPFFVWTIVALLDEEEPDDLGAVMLGMPKEWPVEHEDVFPNGESYRAMVKLWHPDMTRRDTGEEMSIIAQFKNY